MSGQKRSDSVDAAAARAIQERHAAKLAEDINSALSPVSARRMLPLVILAGVGVIFVASVAIGQVILGVGAFGDPEMRQMLIFGLLGPAVIAAAISLRLAIPSRAALDADDRRRAAATAKARASALSEFPGIDGPRSWRRREGARTDALAYLVQKREKMGSNRPERRVGVEDQDIGRDSLTLTFLKDPSRGGSVDRAA